MIHPTIHMNGTSKAQLVKEYEAAYDAVDNAIKVFREITVHGRDYYVQPDYPHVFYRAQDEHQALLNKLFDVRKDLETRLGHLLEQKG